MIKLRREILFSDQSANLLIFGPAGAGTSSLVNSLFSALSNRIHTISASVPGVPGSTQHVFLRWLTPSVLLCEAWGWTKENFTRDEFLEVILQGRIASGTSRYAKFSKGEVLLPKEEHAIDVALVIINVKEMNPERTKQVLQQIRDQDVRVLIGVTHLDLEEPSFRSNPLKSFPAVEAALDRVAAELAVERRHVWPVLPYTAEATCTEHIDLLNLRFLKRAIERTADVRAERRNNYDGTTFT